MTSGEAGMCLIGCKDENEEELLRQAIAFPVENEEKNDEEELLRQAIALSLEDWKSSKIMSLILVRIKSLDNIQE